RSMRPIPNSPSVWVITIWRWRTRRPRRSRTFRVSPPKQHSNWPPRSQVSRSAWIRRRTRYAGRRLMANPGTNPDSAGKAISSEGMAPEGAIKNDGLQGHTTAPGAVHHVADPVDNVLGLTSTGWVAV